MKYLYLWWLISILTDSSLFTLTMISSEFLGSRLSWWFSWRWDSLFHRITAILSQTCLWTKLAALVQTKLVSNSLATDATLWLAHTRRRMFLAFSTYHRFQTSLKRSNNTQLFYKFLIYFPIVITKYYNLFICKMGQAKVDRWTWQDTWREDMQEMGVSCSDTHEARSVANDRARWRQLVTQCSSRDRRTEV